jgi:Ca-activated chloride channel family protein
MLGYCLLAAAGALALWGAGEYTISATSDLVLLDVSVKDAAGGYVTGLKKDAFHVFEDGRPRAITHFSAADTPVTVGLVLDCSRSMQHKRRDVILAGLAFASDSNPHDDFFVVNFNNSLEYGLPKRLPFTDSIQDLRNALYTGKADGQTALYDAIASALKHLERGRQEMRTLIIVSDGGDNVSRIKFAELMKHVEASRATIYTVGLMDPEDRDLNPGVMRKLASVSGGEFFQPATTPEVVPILRKISSDIRHRYVIGYVPDETNDKHVVRTVKVKADAEGRKLVVRTRTSYAIEPPKQYVADEHGFGALSR